MTAGLLKSRQTKLQLLKLKVKTPSAENKSKYSKFRNIYNHLLRIMKVNYFEEKLEKTQKNPKATWKVLNEAINRNKSKSENIEEVKFNNSTVNDNIQIANSFNTFFSEIAGQIRKNIEPTEIKPESYIPENNPEEFNLGLFGPEYVKNIIASLESKTSLDIFNLNTKVIKAVASNISVPLSHIFKLSFETGLVPSKLKISRTVPIFKSGQPDNLSNYRPISCLPILSKILEKIVTKNLYHFLSSNNLIYKYQFGFQSGNSSVHALLHVINFISDAFNKGEFAIGVFLDFQKAFDLVDHNILLMKLEKLGVRGVALNWFKNYLKDRKQFVMVNGVLSSFSKLINISVLQGSILGPLLFLCFINDFHKSNNLFNIHFADDTSCLVKGNNIVELSNIVNSEIQKIGVWLRSNKLSINSSKTKVIIFHPKGKTVENVNFVFNNNEPGKPEKQELISPLERITNHSKPYPAYKLLGVYLDENLNFNYQTNITLKKISRSLFSLRQAKNILNSKALKSLYYALIHPHFLYCLPVVSCTNAQNIHALTQLQKKCIRIISKSRYNAHTAPLYHSLNILPLPDLISQQNLLFLHSVEHKYAPISFHNIFPKNLNNQTLHEYPLRNSEEYYVPRVRNEYLKKFPAYAIPKTWNEINLDSKTLPTPSIFKSKTKKYFIDKLSNFTCNRLYCFVCSNV